MKSCLTQGAAHAEPCLGATILRRDHGGAFKRVVLLAGLVSLATLTACATDPSPSSQAPVAAPVLVSMDEWMNRGDAALKAGDHAKAREAWRSAARDYPTAKQPWLKLSEDYFNDQDYGNAVLAAQEALQRDPHDRVAHSVLAVSGLRLTAGSLTALRDDGAYPVGSRDEAVALTHALREALGEPVLIRPHPTPAPRPGHRDTASTAAGAVVATPAAAPPPAAKTPVAPQPAANHGSPFDKLNN